MKKGIKFSDAITRWMAVVVILAMFGLALTSMVPDSPTFDEQGFLVRGLAYLRGEENGGNRHMRVGHPLGLNALNAALLVSDPTVRLPSEHASWAETSFHRPAELFLWEIGNDVEHIMFLARVPTIWLGLLLVAVSGRWAAEIAAVWSKYKENSHNHKNIAGLIALVLVAFDPNILAHTRLVTTDLGLTAAATFAGFTLWRFARRPSWMRAIVTGVGIGLLLNTKFTALLFLPLFAVVIFMAVALHRREHLATSDGRGYSIILRGSLVIIVVGFTVLWAGHGFQIGPLRAPLPFFGQLGGSAVPLSNYLDQLLDIGNRLEVSTPTFLLGQYSMTGWWYYFPVAFLIKTPLPALLLLLVAAIGALRIVITKYELFRRIWFDFAAVLIPAGGFFAIALTTDINLGYRHILPVLPFLYVFTAAVSGYLVVEWLVRANLLRASVALLLVWFAAASFWIYPHYLAFFNILAGGADDGWKALVDSNLDWGQDMGRLAAWLETHERDSVWLSYFGEARPEYYGIPYQGLDSFPPRLMNPGARPYYPHDPAPGLYAISATTLQGVHFEDHDQFAYFRGLEPFAKIGYSIFLYEQSSRGEPANLLLANTQLDQLLPGDYALLETNDVTLRWFNPGQALLLPEGSAPTWLAIDASSVNPLLAPFLDVDWSEPVANQETYRLFRAHPKGVDATETINLRSDQGAISFLGTPVIEQNESTLTIVTSWRQNVTPQPVKIFIHVLDEGGRIVTQWDGLDVAWEGWRESDTLVHVHNLALEGVPSGDYRIVSGLYDPENLRRWTTQTGDDVLELGWLTIP